MNILHVVELAYSAHPWDQTGGFFKQVILYRISAAVTRQYSDHAQ